MYYISEQKYLLEQEIITRNVIGKNISVYWIVDWRKTDIYHRIIRSLGPNKYTKKKFLITLEYLEESEKVKKKI